MNPPLSPSAVTVAEGLKALGYATAMFGQQNQLAPRFGLAQGFDAYVHKSGNAQRTHRRFLQWLEDGVEDEQPFFAYLHYQELHWPYCPPESTRGRFTSGYAGRSFCWQWRKLRTDLRSGAVVLNDEELQAMVSYYDEQVLGLDLEIARLFEQLRQRGLFEETLILVTSDHGEEFFEHGSMGHGTSLFDELIRVPLVIKPPASWGTAPSVIDGLAELRSVTPTLLEAAGANLVEPWSSLSLLPSLFGEPQEARPYIVSEHAVSVAIRTADLKLVADREDGSVLLYDLVADPMKTRNGADERSDDVAQLKGFLRDWQHSLRRLPSTSEQLDDETIEGLRGLGYLD